MPPCVALHSGQRHRLGTAAAGLPLAQDRAAPPQTLAQTRRLPHRLEAAGRTLSATAGHQLGSDPPGWLQKAVQKRGQATGPSPVDRGKSGTALHLACDSMAMPLGVVV